MCLAGPYLLPASASLPGLELLDAAYLAGVRRRDSHRYPCQVAALTITDASRR
jgi:hypothetical protein